VDPLVKAGGWASPVDFGVLQRLITERPDQTTAELTRAYNRVAPRGRVHRSSIWRALRRTGYVFKKNAPDPWNRTAGGSKPSEPRSSRGPGQ
jgi:hypothetical protein